MLSAQESALENGLEPPAVASGKHGSRQCDTCSVEVPHAAQEALLRECTEVIAQAKQMQKNGQTEAARTKLEDLITRHRAGAGNQSGGGKKGGKRKISPQLHSEHVLVFEALLTLMNCCTAEGDFIASAKHCQSIVKVLQASMPRNSIETSNYLYWHSQLLSKIISTERAGEESGEEHYKGIRNMVGGRQMQGKCKLPAKVLKAYKVDLMKSLQQCWEVRQVCFGAEHDLTQQVKNEIDELGR